MKNSSKQPSIPVMAGDIILPDQKSLYDNIYEAMFGFMAEAEKNWGDDLDDETKEIIEGVFTVGYCIGHCNALKAVIGQQQAVDCCNEILNNINSNQNERGITEKI